MAKKYYTLISRTPGELYAQEFGDYVKSVVTQEMADLKNSGGTPPKTTFKVLTTGDKQVDINAAIAVENSKIEKLALGETK